MRQVVAGGRGVSSILFAAEAHSRMDSDIRFPPGISPSRDLGPRSDIVGPDVSLSNALVQLRAILLSSTTTQKLCRARLLQRSLDRSRAANQISDRSRRNESQAVSHDSDSSRTFRTLPSDNTLRWASLPNQPVPGSAYSLARESWRVILGSRVRS